MARVPEYQNRQVALQPLGAPRVGGQGPDNSGLMQGLGQAQRVSQGIVEAETIKADNAAVLEADRQATDWQFNKFFDSESGVYSKKGVNALDITNQTLGDFDKMQSKLSESLTNERQKSRFNDVMMRRRESLSGDLNKYEYGQRESYYDNIDRGQIETSLQGAALYYDDPSKVGQYLRKGASVIANQGERKGLPAEAVQVEQLKYSSSVHSSVAGRMANDDPYKAREYFNANQGGMTAGDQIQTENMIEREIKQREVAARQMQAIARVEMGSRLQDASAAYLQGLEFDSPPKQAELVAAYGAKEGTERYQSLVKMQEIGGAVREMATAEPARRAELIEQFNPAKGGVAGGGFKEDSQLMGVAVNAATALAKELETDPARYVAKYSPFVQQALEGLDSGGPAATQAYAEATLAEQSRLGALNPKLLTDAQASSIVRQFSQVEDGGTNSATMVSQLSDQWGQYWPDVYKQLQKDLPAAALVIGSGVDGATAATLARIAPLKNEELKKGLASTDVTDAREALQDSMVDFRNTLGQQVGGERTFATMYGEAERLTLAYMGQGNSPSDAADKAYRALVDDKYNIVDAWRAPKQYDADLIERGASLALDAIDPASLAYTVPQGVDDAFAKERIKQAITGDGYWVTAPDESGLALYLNGEAVLDKAGSPIIRNWNDLTGTAANSPSTFERFNEGRQRMNDASKATGRPAQ